MNLEELIEQRHREKRERLRHRFLNMNKPSSSGRGYVVTVLRPPTPRTSQRSLIEEENEEEEEQREEEQTKEPDSDAANKKPDKYE